jgi:hypothetical protein
MTRDLPPVTRVEKVCVALLALVSVSALIASGWHMMVH